MKKMALIIAALVSAIGTARGQEMKIKSMLLTSDVFEEGGDIPDIHACLGCNGEKMSPPLSWEKIDNAVSYALICEDRDVKPNGPYIHWIAFNIPGTVTQLPSMVGSKDTNIKDMGGVEGANTAGTIGYVGLCPPPYTEHHYYFTIWALDTKLNLSEGVTVTPFKEALEGHIIAKGTLMGTYICKIKE